MRIGSGQFIGVVVLVAFAAAAAGLQLETRPLLWCAVVVGVYALHLLAIHAATGKAEARAPRAALRDDSKALDTEREELERLRGELERKMAQTEGQWTLLRSMVQERVRRSADSGADAPGRMFDAHSSPDITGGRAVDAKPDVDESGRSYGRW